LPVHSTVVPGTGPPPARRSTPRCVCSRAPALAAPTWWTHSTPRCALRLRPPTPHAAAPSRRPFFAAAPLAAPFTTHHADSSTCAHSLMCSSEAKRALLLVQRGTEERIHHTILVSIAEPFFFPLHLAWGRLLSTPPRASLHAHSLGGRERLRDNRSAAATPTRSPATPRRPVAAETWSPRRLLQLLSFPARPLLLRGLARRPPLLLLEHAPSHLTNRIS